jgi:hypothetical protein
LGWCLLTLCDQTIDILLRVNAGGILSVGDFRFAVPPSIHAVRIHGDAHGLSGWNCWECQAPGTPILDRVRPSWLFLPGEGRVGVNGLGVTLNRACNSQLRSYSVRIRRSSTGSDYCSVAWGGEAAIVGRGRITLFSLASYF